MICDLFAAPMASPGATGPAVSDATAACTHGYGSALPTAPTVSSASRRGQAAPSKVNDGHGGSESHQPEKRQPGSIQPELPRMLLLLNHVSLSGSIPRAQESRLGGPAAKFQ